MDAIITVPFGYLLDFLYRFTSNYGVALILFAVIVRLVLLPINAKSRKSMMKMSRLQPRIQEIQKKYENDQQKQQEAIKKLQDEEGASMGCGGCIWSLIPMLILFPLYSIIRMPLQYMLHETAETATAVVEVIKNAAPDLFTAANAAYDQVIAVRHLPDFLADIQAAGITLNDSTLAGLNFEFLGVDLGKIPTYNVFAADWAWDWAHIGLLLIPVLSAGTQVLSMWISQKANNSLITDDKGIQDKEAAEKSQANQTTNMMMWMMPLMSLWIGFSVPGALSLYWLIGSVAMMIENPLMTNHYRKIYDAEDAERLKRHMEAEALEAEKERVRAERRAANPEGQTQNMSKKKQQQKKLAETEAAKAAAAKEYAAKHGIVLEEEEEKATMSGVSDRPWCKGRAYDPDRYSNSTEE